MAGTLQTLIFTPSTTKSLFFPHGNPPSPSKHAAFSIGGSIDSRRRSLISRPIIIRACDSSNQNEGNGKRGGQVSSLAEGLIWARPLLNFASNNFLPLALLGGVTIGLGNPSIGCLADRYSLSKFSTFGIFIISGLTLRSGDIGAAREAWPVGLLGLLAGGNSALALAMTLISNLLGILIIPFSISKFIASGVGVSVPTKQLLKSLVQTLLIPLILGKVFDLFLCGSLRW
ncbi:Sodium Bile acid symporter family [Parasponia andersonii]|uniref:Sodium Bile acid symporter family n=1 Tax=Parasponia andersonii TaxID=3476 RepID=A0A2P5DD14_PARAD|nr:Sodium Bile acid symporter family [Parasponia andersonii]